MIKGWLKRILDPPPETKERALWKGRAAQQVVDYTQESVDAHIMHLLTRMAMTPDDPSVALALKGEGRFLYLWIRGLQTSIQSGEAAGK